MLAYFLAAIVVLVLVHAKMTRVKLDHIPALGRSGTLSSYLEITDFQRNALKLMADGCRKYQGRLFKIPMIDKWLVIVSDSVKINELRNAKESEMSFRKAAHDNLSIQNAYHVDVVRGVFTRNIAGRFADVRDEIVASFNDCIPQAVEKEWVPIPALAMMRQIISRVSNRYFIGLPLCRDPDWLDLNIRYTIDIVMASHTIKLFPDILKPIVGPYLSPYKKSIARARKHLYTTVKERIEAWNAGNRDELPNDLITWLLTESPESEPLEVDGILSRVLLVNFAAIHTSSNSITQALFHLAAAPEYVEPMREEVKRVIGAEGWTKASMNKLRKVDSFLRESQRLTGIGALLMQRVVTNPNGFTFSDGSYVPYGAYVAVPAYDIHHDEKNYQDPNVFDGFRFYNMRSADESESVKHQMVNTGLDYLAFGHGRHACPGRFFAVNELKAMFTHILLNYHIKLPDGTEGMPKPRWFAASNTPSGSDVLWKKRI